MPEAGGRRPGAGGQRLEARARGQRLDARSWLGGGCWMDVIRKQLDVICAECIVRPLKYMRKVKNLLFLRDKKVHFFGPRGNIGEILGDESLARALRKISSRQN